MTKLSAGTVSGCLVWVLVFSVISMCLLPAAMIIGGITSGADFTAKILGRVYCSEDTTPEIYSYPTTTTDEFGNSQPATGYELHCVDANGEVVNTSAVGYAFLWTGILAGVGLLVSAILAFVLAAPAGVLIGKAMNRNKRGPVA